MAIEYYLSNAESTTAIVKCKANLGLSTTLEYSVNSDFTGSTITGAETPVSGDNFIATFSLTGLSAVTQYYFRAIENSVTDTASGKFKTMAAAGTPQNIKFAFSGDADDTNNSQSFANVAALTDIDFYLCTGDMHYGDVSTNTEAAYFTEYDGVLTQTNQKSMYENHALLYAWDDHDYGTNDSGSSSPSKVSAASAFRKMIPTNSLVNRSGSIESVTVYGRVKFILLDNRYDRSGVTILGTTQKAWLLTQFEESASNDNIALTIVSTGVPWISSSGTDTWFGAAAERTDISNKIFSEGLEGQVAFVCGDMHAITHDDGTNNTFDTLSRTGWPVFQSAPMGRAGSTKGGPYTGTVYVGDTDGQYSTMEILDDGKSINVTVVGYSKVEAVLYTYEFAVDAVQATGFNIEVRDKMAVTDVVRTSDTVVTVTLPASAAYDIDSQEIVTSIIPDAALVTATGQITATPTFTIDPILTTWNTEVRDKEVVTAVVRTSDTVVTITLTASPDYDITSQETITSTIPNAALITSGLDVIAAPTFTVDPVAGGIIMSISESAGIVDVQLAQFGAISTISESAALVDIESSRFSAGMSIAEAAAGTDTDSGQAMMNATIAEALAASDVLSTLGSGALTVEVSEAVLSADNVSFSASFSMTISESSLATDAVVAIVPIAYNLTINEGASVIDRFNYAAVAGLITAVITINPIISGTITDGSKVSGEINDIPVITGTITVS